MSKIKDMVIDQMNNDRKSNIQIIPEPIVYDFHCYLTRKNITTCVYGDSREDLLYKINKHVDGIEANVYLERLFLETDINHCEIKDGYKISIIKTDTHIF